MRRREFIVVIGGAVVWPLAVRAQEVGRTYRLGVVTISPRTAPYFVAMFDVLRRAGFIEGQNLRIDWRSHGARVELIPEFVAELVNAKEDVIYVTGELGIRAAQKATTMIPIIGLAEDMVGSGLVNSLAHPGGNTTGLSVLAMELNGKRQEILIEAVPGLGRMAVLADPNQTTPQQLRELKGAARARGVELSIHLVTTAEEIPVAIEAMKASGAAALNVLPSSLLYGNRQIIFQRATEMRIPAIYQSPEEAEEGGFIAYGARLVPMFRDLVAPQLVKLLRGVKPADIPVEQPTKFELVINVKTAKALGLTIPESFLVRADEVIE
jgi:putative tryptophan/tyrosine transport system substrate-binding protein